MNQRVLIAKEFKEMVKTRKIIVMPLLFIIFGILSPISALAAPELIKSISGTAHIVIPKPTVFDAYDQFFKNLNQIQVVILIFTTMNIVVEEKMNGVLMLLTTKPVSKSGYIFSKLLSQSFLILISLTLGSAAFIYYTIVLFHRFNFSGFIIAVAYYFLYIMVFITMTTFFSTIASNLTVAGICSFLGFTIINLTGYIEKIIGYYTPATLKGNQILLVRKGWYAINNLAPVYCSILLIVVFIALSILSFRNQEM
ncbi:ABC transporter permease subunit [Ruminiclostridium herbifermentans]|uniref:ABC transporter permease subunit n=1 Tax=Ruminiclostridium herbifermentans TaxID=2488810 RepID=A0A4U7JKM9_9FIRM|nr:ABC transporter permease subunit [Ruminiclostridium herbifermentans]QNU67074.1 ABC transporter permease subunit [Ruminiclostridium herbifermentans]